MGHCGNAGPADGVREDRRHRRRRAVRPSRPSKGGLQRLGSWLRPGRLAQGAGRAGEGAEPDRDACADRRRGSARLSADLLVLDAQGARGNRFSSRQDSEPGRMAEHREEWRLSIVPRAWHPRNTHHAERVQHRAGRGRRLGAALAGRAGVELDGPRHRAARHRPRAQAVRRLDRPDRGRRAPIREPGAAARHRP